MIVPNSGSILLLGGLLLSSFGFASKSSLSHSTVSSQPAQGIVDARALCQNHVQDDVSAPFLLDPPSVVKRMDNGDEADQVLDYRKEETGTSPGRGDYTSAASTSGLHTSIRHFDVIASLLCQNERDLASYLGVREAINAGKEIVNVSFIARLRDMQRLIPNNGLVAMSTAKLWPALQDDLRFLFHMLGPWAENFEILFARQGSYVRYIIACIKEPEQFLRHTTDYPEFKEGDEKFVRALSKWSKKDMKEFFKNGKAKQVILQMTKSLFDCDFVIEARKFEPLKEYALVAAIETPRDVYLHFQQQESSAWRAKLQRSIFEEVIERPIKKAKSPVDESSESGHENPPTSTATIQEWCDNARLGAQDRG